MATHSPQRARRSQVLLPNQGPQQHNAQQPRETSRSPSLRDRPRSLKAQSMPMVPGLNQLYGPGGNPNPQQSSPTISNTSAPSSGRLLPIPPDQPQSHHSAQNGGAYEVNSDQRMSPATGPAPNDFAYTQPRAVRHTAPAFLKNLTDAEMEEHLKMTEVLADIERSDQPPAQSQQPVASVPPSEYPYVGVYGQAPRSETPSPPKDPIERVRAMDRNSPNNPEVHLRRQRDIPSRESPKVPVRQPTSPSNPAFAGGAPTPERRNSPKLLPSGGLNENVGYAPYATRPDAPVVTRRATTTGLMDSRPLPYTHTQTQTPPLQSVARTPDRDRSLPVQELEEVEDDSFGGGHSKAQGHWKNGSDHSIDHQHRISSPTPSSDLNPDGSSAQRYERPQQPSSANVGRTESRNGRRGDDNSPHPQQHLSSGSESTNRFSEGDGEDSGSYTPRSPTANLPDPRVGLDSKSFYQQAANPRLSPKVLQNVTSNSSRVKSRNGSIDGLGLRTIDFDAAGNGPASGAPVSSNSERPPYVDHRQHVPESQYRGESQQPHQQQRYQPNEQPTKQHSQPPQQHHQQQQQPVPAQYDHYRNAQPSPHHSHHSSLPPQSPQLHEPPSPALEYYQAANAYYGRAPSVYPDDFQNYREDPASLAYLHAYLASPRPDAPIPPTPHSQSSAPSPSPFLMNGLGPGGYAGKHGIGMPPQQYVPVVPVGSPYPYPFTHVRRTRPVSSLAGGPGGGGAIIPQGHAAAANAHSQLGSSSNGSNSYDPNHPAAIQEQLAKQWQIYLQNQANGNMTDSTFSPAATPFQGANYNPFTFLHTARLTRQMQQGRESAGTRSLHSSPSHEPVPLPTAPGLVGRRKDRERGVPRGVAAARKKQQAQQQATQQQSQPQQPQRPVVQPPPRVDSTQPRDTSPEPSSSGEETAGEYAPSTAHSNSLLMDDAGNNGPTTAKQLNGDHQHNGWPGSSVGGASSTADSASAGKTTDVDDNSDDWIDEDDEADDSDVLDFEYHPNYIPNSDKRRRRWEVGWEGLVQAFQNLDRQTDTTMVVLAAPPHSSKLYSIRSRSIRRASVLRNSVALSELRSSFKRLSTQRKNLRPAKPQFLGVTDKFLDGSFSGTSGDGSDGSTESKEEDLRKALEVALGSLNMLNGMYEMRESRWQEEMKRMQEDKEKMAFYLNQVLGSFQVAPRSAGPPMNGQMPGQRDLETPGTM